MTWATASAEIVAGITAVSSTYKRLERDMDVESAGTSRQNLGYTLRVIGTDDRELTSNSLVGSYLVELEVSLKHKDNTERDTAFDTMITLKQGLWDLTNFSSFVGESNPNIERINDQWSKAIFTFYYGVLEC